MVKRMKKRRTYRAQSWLELALLWVAVVVLNLLGAQYYKRFDLTKEGRFTLSETSVKLAEQVKDKMLVKVYLEGELSAKFKRLKLATMDMLTEFRAASDNNIDYEFIDPFKDKTNEEKKSIVEQLQEKGLMPYNDFDADDIEQQKNNLIIPGAEIYYNGGKGDKNIPVYLLSTTLGMADEENINRSVELLEYELANGIRRCVSSKSKNIGFSSGHGEYSDLQLADISAALSEYYTVDRFPFSFTDTNKITFRLASEMRKYPDSSAQILINGYLREIMAYDAIVVARPRRDFSKEESFIIDQFVMNGGKVLWLVDMVNAETDSLAYYNKIMATDYGLENIHQMIFRYGARIDFNLIRDLRCNNIKMLSTYGQKTFREYPWVYFPVFVSENNHPINRNIEAVWGQFVSSVTPLNRDRQKATKLLTSSDRTMIVNAPSVVDLELVKENNNPQYLSGFNAGMQTVGVLLEGEFNSFFKARKVEAGIPFKEKTTNSMIVISDADIIRNLVKGESGVYFELGFDRATGRTFANKKFMLNCFDYLLDDSGLIEVRSKEIVMRLLDRSKVKEERMKWQLVNMVAPIVAVLLFGFINAWIRKRKYA